MDSTTLLLGGAVLLCVLWWLSTRRPPGLPPGPGPALPLLGHLHLMGKDPRPQFWRWKRQYGDVFSIYMGWRLVVVLTSYSAIREALVTLADVFSHRPHNFSNDYILERKGISASSGPMWKEQRKTSLEILRQMGMGKNVLAEKIQEEITHYIRAVRDHQGAPVDLLRTTQVSVSNNICSIVFGKRFHYSDPEFLKYIELSLDSLKVLPETGIAHFLPIFRHIPGDPFKLNLVLSNFRTLFDFIDQQIAQHQRVLSQDTAKAADQSTDYIFCYLQQMQQCKALGRADTTLDEDNLQKCVQDLFVAGTETTSTTIMWALLFFLYHPHVQDKCYQEISDVIGPHRPPSMSDRAKMTYLEATICEVLRRADIAPLAVWHATAQDVMFRNYVIPKGTTVTPDVNCVLQDPEIWQDPDNFRPERFIGPDGKLTKPEEFIPFSTGRRVCLGESLARMELFLYLVTLVQRFRFLPPEEGQLPSLEAEVGMTYSPQPYTIRAVPRF